ncbi:MAG: sigma 54-interacting transcriptional regulator, partial [Thermodesulfobacteriota bacterium]
KAESMVCKFAAEDQNTLRALLLTEDAGGEPRLGEVLRLRDKTLVANVAPIRVDGEPLGTVITLTEASELQQIEWKIRQQLAEQGTVARYRLEDFIGQSEPVRLLKQRVRAFAATDSTILICGETGTGKEILAHSIHHLSRRRKGPFVSVNCSALPKELVESELFGYEEGAFTGARKRGKPGLFELAHTGTIFLDEVGTLPLDAQAKLLRVIEEKRVMRLGGVRLIPVDVRIIAATNTNLQEAIERNEFRQDLFFRLNILNVRVPPLRERPEDIPLLLEHFVRSLGGELRRISLPRSPLVDRLQSYQWPGNVRELKNFAERFVTSASHEADAEACFSRLARELLACHGQQNTESAPVPATPVEAVHHQREDGGPTANGPVSTVEEAAQMVARSQRDLLYSVGMSLNWNRKKMAKALGISTTTLWRRLKKAGINEFRLEPVPGADRRGPQKSPDGWAAEQRRNDRHGD